jgi:hypothetical protein
MQTPQLILANTPWWVWLVLAVLVALGIQALRPRRVTLARALITPVVFSIWGLIGLVLTALGAPAALLAWAVAAAAGAAVASLRPVRLAVADGLVQLPGSPAPLLRNLLIFAVKFALAVALARLPERHAELVLWDAGVSGALAGYFLGWMVKVIRFYRRAAPAGPGLAARERAG